MNGLLEPFNLRVDTLTARRQEAGRLERLSHEGYFDRPAFPIPPGVASCDPSPILEAIRQYRDRFRTFQDSRDNDVGYSFANEYFTSPDAEVLYAMVRSCAPATLVEVGSGNSTRISRQAVIDGRLETKLVAIDPAPRVDIDEFADELCRHTVETVGANNPLERLRSGDILFIDSSHEILPGNDCVFLYLRAMPRLPAGVIIHIHDVFLPFEYPAWVRDEHRVWTEQYLVQAILMEGQSYDVLWPGYYLQRTRPEFAEWFPHAGKRSAQSLWLRTRR